MWYTMYVLVLTYSRGIAKDSALDFLRLPPTVIRNGENDQQSLLQTAGSTGTMIKTLKGKMLGTELVIILYAYTLYSIIQVPREKAITRKRKLLCEICQLKTFEVQRRTRW